MIEVKELYKSFGATQAVKNVTFTARRGQIFGLLGPNGAGKTTTLRMIVNILKPDQGEISIFGEPIRPETLDKIGYLPEDRGLYLDQNVYDVLFYLASIKGVPHTRAKVDIVRFLDRLDLIEYADKKIETLSRGNQQKIQLIASMLHDPDIVILDEPFSGLDPINQTVVRELIQELKYNKKTVILSSHRMELVESLCDYICLLNKGEIILEGPLEEIQKRESEGAIVIEAAGDLTFLSARKDIRDLKYTRTGAIINVDKNFKFNEFVRELTEKVELQKIEKKMPTLRDLYLTAIKKHAEQQ